jgi:hypothetical protein
MICGMRRAIMSSERVCLAALSTLASLYVQALCTEHSMSSARDNVSVPHIMLSLLTSH